MSRSIESEGSDESGLTDFERSLGSLKPASQIQRDTILFLAGQQHAYAMKRRNRSAWPFWPAIAACLSGVTIGQGILLARRPASEVRTVYVQVPQYSPPSGESPETASNPQLATVPATLDSQEFQADDRHFPLRLRQNLYQTHYSPMIALFPTKKPLTAAEGLKFRRTETFDPGDSL